MKHTVTTRRAFCAMMAVLLVFLSAGAAFDYQERQASPAQQPAESSPPEPGAPGSTLGSGVKKSETVYVNLDAGGKPYDITVTDWLHSDQPGARLDDMTTLKNIVNIKGDEQPRQNGEKVSWDLSGNDLYYQGASDKALPLEVSVEYYLDDVKLTPEEIAGKSGRLRMEIGFRNATSHQVQVAGQTVEMHTPLMVMAGMSLDGETFSNVEVSDGTVMTDGDKQVVALVSMPGLSKSLNLGGYSIKEINDLDFPEEFTVTADVKEFEMGPIGVVATTKLPNLDDFKKSEDIDDMRADLYDLRDMQNDLDVVDPDRDLRSLFTDQGRTEAAQLLVDDIFDFYDLNKDIMDILPRYITPENIALYDRIRYDLKDSTMDTLLDDEAMADILELVDDLSPTRLQDLADDYAELEKKPKLKAELDALIKTLGSQEFQMLLGSLQPQDLIVSMEAGAKEKVKAQLLGMLNTEQGKRKVMNLLREAEYPVASIALYSEDEGDFTPVQLRVRKDSGRVMDSGPVKDSGPALYGAEVSVLPTGMQYYMLAGMIDDYVQKYWKELAPEADAQIQAMAAAFGKLANISPDLTNYLKNFAEDLRVNKDNLETLLLLLEKLDEEDLLDDVEYIDELRQDMRDLRPILRRLRLDLNNPDMKVSLHKSPETTETLLRMKEDLEEHRDITESLRTATAQENVDISRRMIDTLDRLQAKDATGDAISKIDDLDELLARKDAFVELSEQYSIYTEAADGMDAEVKFIMKTDDIEKPEPEEVPVQAQPEKEGFLQWIKGLASGINKK